MGKLKNERKISFYYIDLFISQWNAQTQEFKDKCEEIGQPYGYSGQNVFYVFLYKWLQYYWAGLDPEKTYWEEVA